MLSHKLKNPPLGLSGRGGWQEWGQQSAGNSWNVFCGAGAGGWLLRGCQDLEHKDVAVYLLVFLVMC